MKTDFSLRNGRIGLAVSLFATGLLWLAAPNACPGAAIALDGVNDYVTFGPAPALGVSTFTIETWFLRTGAGVSTSTGYGGLDAIPLVTKGRAEVDGTTQDMNYFL